jgi:hypothetical protein
MPEEESFPVPFAVNTMSFKVIGSKALLVTTTPKTGTLAAPGIWTELTKAGTAAAILTAGVVKVFVGVAVPVAVAVFVGVEVAVEVPVSVGVFVAVEVAVLVPVSVAVAVAVDVAVSVAVWVAVKVAVEVAVLVAVLVGVAVGCAIVITAPLTGAPFTKIARNAPVPVRSPFNATLA